MLGTGLGTLFLAPGWTKPEQQLLGIGLDPYFGHRAGLLVFGTGLDTSREAVSWTPCVSHSAGRLFWLDALCKA